MPGGGLIRRPCSRISLICEPSRVSYSSKRFCDGFECVAIGNERVLRQLIGVVDESAHFLVDLFGSRFAVIARARNVASEENVIFVFAVFDHAHFLAHAPFANHATRNGRGAS